MKSSNRNLILSYLFVATAVTIVAATNAEAKGGSFSSPSRSVSVSRPSAPSSRSFGSISRPSSSSSHTTSSEGSSSSSSTPTRSTYRPTSVTPVISNTRPSRKSDDYDNKGKKVDSTESSNKNFSEKSSRSSTGTTTPNRIRTVRFYERTVPNQMQYNRDLDYMNFQIMMTNNEILRHQLNADRAYYMAINKSYNSQYVENSPNTLPPTEEMRADIQNTKDNVAKSEQEKKEEKNIFWEILKGFVTFIAYVIAFAMMIVMVMYVLIRLKIMK